MTRTSTPTRRLAGDQGAALPELALIMPFLALLAFGVLEFGLAWKSVTNVERGAAAAGRAAATMGVNPRADHETLRAVNAALASANGVEVERVIIYRATASNGDVPGSCLAIQPAHTSLSASGVPGSCNVYSRAQVQTESIANFGYTVNGDGDPTACTGGSWHEDWCPIGRERRRPPEATPDHIGVYVEVTQSTVTGLFTDEFTIGRQAVFLIEPPSLGDDN